MLLSSSPTTRELLEEIVPYLQLPLFSSSFLSPISQLIYCLLFPRLPRRESERKSALGRRRGHWVPLLPSLSHPPLAFPIWRRLRRPETYFFLCHPPFFYPCGEKGGKEVGGAGKKGSLIFFLSLLLVA